MTKRILAIAFIYACTAVGWIILASTISFRTHTQDTRLKNAVAQLWGTRQIQQAPSLYYYPSGAGQKTHKNHNAAEHLALDSSDIEVSLKLDHRKKGLLWYSTYRVTFSGSYRIVNHFDESKTMFLSFSFPAAGAVYDNFRFTVGDREIQDVGLKQGNITRTLKLSPGQAEEVEISYASQGLEEWAYDFGDNVNAIRNFYLVMQTDFEQIDFPTQSISPTQKERAADGWKLTWQYSNLLTDVKIGMITPQRLNPGPWVSRVTAAAPVSLFLFFFLLFVFTTIKKVKIHPVNYFFIGAAFFSFHLLLAYLVDHISIHAAFWICSLVSIFLVVSYMRLVVGARVAFIQIALSQLVYLVLFSYTFFFKGYTGLVITILCICTLFVVMQSTAKIEWDKLFAKSNEIADSKKSEKLLA